MFIAKRTYQRVQALIEKVIIIQREYRLRLHYKATQKEIMNKWHSWHDQFIKRQEEFML